MRSTVQPLGGLDALAGDARGYVAGAEPLSQVVVVVALVGMKIGRTPSAWSASGTDRRDPAHERHHTNDGNRKTQIQHAVSGAAGDTTTYTYGQSADPTKRPDTLTSTIALGVDGGSVVLAVYGPGDVAGRVVGVFGVVDGGRCGVALGVVDLGDVAGVVVVAVAEGNLLIQTDPTGKKTLYLPHLAASPASPEPTPTPTPTPPTPNFRRASATRQPARGNRQRRLQRLRPAQLRRRTEHLHRLHQLRRILPGAQHDPRPASQWIVSRPETLTEIEQLRLKAVLANCPELDALTGHVRSFAQMLTEHQGERLPQ